MVELNRSYAKEHRAQPGVGLLKRRPRRLCLKSAFRQALSDSAGGFSRFPAARIRGARVCFVRWSIVGTRGGHVCCSRQDAKESDYGFGHMLGTACRWAQFLSLALAAVILLSAAPAWAQFGGFVQQVAGVWIDADGILRNREVDETNECTAPGSTCCSRCRSSPSIWACAKFRSDGWKPRSPSIAKPAAARRRNAISWPACSAFNMSLSIREEQDIVLAGPGEGWKINEQGEVVGLTTGRPVMWLDDLVVALAVGRRPPSKPASVARSIPATKASCGCKSWSPNWHSRSGTIGTKWTRP